MEANLESLNPVWLSDPLRGLMLSLTDAGFEAFAVGGCVRDAVMERECNDIDIATNATPDQVHDVLKAHGCKMVPTGVEHGTWTAIKSGQAYEVTTYRRDVATDGRRATIEYAETMEEDAERRDFTMNALYMDVDGNVYDPTGTGVADAKAGLVRFVGDANTRCEEDYLRILRYFRFLATHSDSTIDKKAISACLRNAPGLKSVSKERVLTEIIKLLCAENKGRIQLTLSHMYERGIMEEVFPKGVCILSHRNLIGNEHAIGLKADWRTRLYCLAGKHIDLPFSKKDRVFIETLANLHENPSDYDWHALAYLHGAEIIRQLGLIVGEGFEEKQIEYAAMREFPVSSQHFIEKGFTQGPSLGKAMREAKHFWLMTGMRHDSTACVRAAMLEVAVE